MTLRNWVLLQVVHGLTLKFGVQLANPEWATAHWRATSGINTAGSNHAGILCGDVHSGDLRNARVHEIWCTQRSSDNKEDNTSHQIHPHF